MKSIKPRKLTNARNFEHLFFHGEVLKAISEELAERFGFAELRAKYLKLYKIEEKAVTMNRRFFATQAVRETDKERDALQIYANQIIKANLKSPSAEMREAARVLRHEFRPFRKGYAESYDANSTDAQVLVERLQAEPIAGYVAKLGLTETVRLLGEVNERFRELQAQRTAEYYERVQTPKSRVIRPQVDRALRECSDAVNTMYLANKLVGKDPEVEALLSGVIDAVNTASNILTKNVSVRAARAAGKREEED